MRRGLGWKLLFYYITEDRIFLLNDQKQPLLFLQATLWSPPPFLRLLFPMDCVTHHKISAGLSTHLANNEDVSNKGCVMYKICHNLIPFQNVASFKFVVMIMPVEGVERKMNSNIDAWFASSLTFSFLSFIVGTNENASLLSQH